MEFPLVKLDGEVWERSVIFLDSISFQLSYPLLVPSADVTRHKWKSHPGRCIISVEEIFK